MTEQTNSAWRKRKPMDNVVRDWQDKTQRPSPSDEIRHAINAKIEEMAAECERFPFSDTAASFAIWIRGHKV